MELGAPAKEAASRHRPLWPEAQNDELQFMIASTRVKASRECSSRSGYSQTQRSEIDKRRHTVLAREPDGVIADPLAVVSSGALQFQIDDR
jgi:hypothetical protein